MAHVFSPATKKTTAVTIAAAAAASAAASALLLAPLPAANAQVNVQINVRADGKVDVDKNPVVDTIENGKGRINYAAGMVKATGYGAVPKGYPAPQAKLMAMGAAKADALRNLAMTVSSIQVTATTKVKNYVLQSDVVETKLETLLQSPQVISEKFNNDGTATVIVALPMYGENSVAAAVLPQVINTEQPVEIPAAPAGMAVFKGPDEPAVAIKAPTAKRPDYSLPGGAEPGTTSASDSGPFSAVIIDCRGLGINAIMSPKIYDTSGREVYGTVRVSPEYAIETGIASYPRSMGEALASSRAGSHPLIVRAIRAGDKHRFNPVISLADAERILDANSRDHFLERTAVVILVDPIR